MQPELRAKITLFNPVHFAAVGFGSGLVPFMPGTWGSLAAVPLILGLSLLAPWWLVVSAIVACLAGVLICDITAKAMGVHDHGSIVWDEIAGMLITFCFIGISTQTLITGFVLFRIFDILKPWPISFVDKHVHGGLGIMLDDIIAGVFACGVLHLLVWTLPGFFGL